MNKDFLKLYNCQPVEATEYPRHEGGRNRVYRCGDMVIRLSEPSDRTYEDFLAEAEYVAFLAGHGAACVDVIPSVNGRLVEQADGAFVTAFTLAKGEQIADHGYRYREGAPLSEYFYNTGKTLGRMHALSKKYQPAHRRFDFFEKYNDEYFAALIPGEYGELKAALSRLLARLGALPKTADSYGMVHFDFSDGNYNIDYNTGEITVFDFENCRTCFYLFDLANLWTHGVGWVAYEEDANRRRAYMDGYFNTILDGYRSETELPEDALSILPLMIMAVLMENIIDEFEVQRAETGGFELDAEQAYRIRCMVEGIPFMGFFSDIFSPDQPFELAPDLL